MEDKFLGLDPQDWFNLIVFLYLTGLALLYLSLRMGW
jgi:hypothetical protein